MSPSVASRRWRLALRMELAALVWSAGLVLAALVIPAYNGQTTTSSQGVTLTTATLVQVNGVKAVVIVAVPLVVSLVVIFALHRRRVAGAVWSGPVAWTMIAVLMVECLLGILSVGAFMIPVVIALALATRLVVAPDRITTAGRSQPTA